MALINCPKCGKKISDKALYCPKCGFSASGISNNYYPDDNDHITTAGFTNEQIMMAVKPYVCKQLKSPASAQFPMDAIYIIGNSNAGYHIKGFVDSQNGFGAMIRNDFSAEVCVINGSLQVLSCSVGVKTIQANTSTFFQYWIFYIILSALGGLIFYFFISVSIGGF